MDLTIILIALNSIIFAISFGLAVLNGKNGKRMLMLLDILIAVLSLISTAIYVCIYLKIPPPF